MSTFYTNEQRDLQEQFETAKMADLLHQVIVHSEVQEAERAFIESRDKAGGTITVDEYETKPSVGEA